VARARAAREPRNTRAEGTAASGAMQRRQTSAPCSSQ
jgi:hypothetical protein